MKFEDFNAKMPYYSMGIISEQTHSLLLDVLIILMIAKIAYGFFNNKND